MPPASAWLVEPPVGSRDSDDAPVGAPGESV